ncbi:hypothetical protein J2793_007514, partial [Paraburkholderia caledonica]|nr:hypothetical protein [Paraburkholderia caledonica]
WGELSGGYAASDFSPPAKTFAATPAKMIVALQMPEDELCDRAV